MVIACLCHDLDHRGTNNKFQVNSKRLNEMPVQA